MLSTSVILLFTSFLGASQAQSLGACPTAEYQITASDGSIYTVCRGTDLRGETAQQVPSRNLAECADACQQQGSPWCSMAVYDPQQFACNLKSGPLDWVRSNRYTTVTRIQTGDQGGQQGGQWGPGDDLSRCPSNEQFINSAGVTLAICPNTDYEGPTNQIIPDVSSVQACAKNCAVDPQCQNAVYESNSGQCYIKVAPDQIRFTYNPVFSSVRVVRTRK